MTAPEKKFQLHARDEFRAELCGVCNGTGEQELPAETHRVGLVGRVQCRQCGGSGAFAEHDRVRTLKVRAFESLSDGYGVEIDLLDAQALIDLLFAEFADLDVEQKMFEAKPTDATERAPIDTVAEAEARGFEPVSSCGECGGPREKDTMPCVRCVARAQAEFEPIPPPKKSKRCGTPVEQDGTWRKCSRNLGHEGLCTAPKKRAPRQVDLTEAIDATKDGAQ